MISKKGARSSTVKEIIQETIGIRGTATVERSRALVAVREVRGSNPARVNIFRGLATRVSITRG